jgi:hypothetical protein
MALPAYGSAAQSTQLMLQTINKDVDLLENTDSELDSRFSDKGPETKTSLLDFRIPMEVEMGGRLSAFSTDGGNLNQGVGFEYDQGQMTPYELDIAAAATVLEKTISDSGPTVTIMDPVAKMIAQLKEKMSIKRNQLLQTSNNGQVATINSGYVTNANPITLASTSFGGRLLNRGDGVQITDTSFNLIGPANVVDVYNKSVGGTDSITVDTVPTGTAAGYYVLIPGVAAGTPLFFNGLEYLVNPAFSGEYLGISRANSYVQSPSMNANGSLFTLGLAQAFLVRMVQNNGVKNFKAKRSKNFWYGHGAQWLSIQTLGFAKQQNVMSDGKASNFDGLPDITSTKMLGGFEYVEDSTAAIDKIYFLDQTTLVRCRFGKGPRFLPGLYEGIYWPRNSGNTWNTTMDVHFIDGVNYATKNCWANGVMYGLGLQGVLSN